jgi:NAD(P)-dependent dehydrogenase (short-subunit alcohol dehydrogenase family)
MMSVNLTGRIAVVTGASRGIGYFTALELAKAGAHVVACARTVGGLEDLDDAIKAVGGSATLVPFDLADMGAIDALGGAIFERWGKLDIMVANAGVLGTIAPIGHVEAKTFEKVMTVNVTATWRLIRSLDPLLQKSDQGRALILTSSLAHKCKPFWAPYSASKAAVEALARTWANESERLPLKIISVDPGGTRTAMRAQAYPGEDPETLPHPRDVAKVIAGLTGPDMNETGKLYLVREQRFADYVLP